MLSKLIKANANLPKNERLNELQLKELQETYVFNCCKRLRELSKVCKVEDIPDKLINKIIHEEYDLMMHSVFGKTKFIFNSTLHKTLFYTLAEKGKMNMGAVTN